MSTTASHAPGEGASRGTFMEAYRRLQLAQKGAGLHAPAYSRFINRRLGRILAAAAYKIGMTPNMVTVVSALFTYSGIALLVIFPPSGWLGLTVSLLLVVGYAFDSADGQVARLTRGGSPGGEWLDHVADAIKISALPVALTIGLYRFDAVPEAWLLVPLASAVVGPVLFFAMILTEQLRKAQGTVMPSALAAPGAASWARSVMVIPMDYGVLCLVFAFLGILPLFLGLYLLTVLATAGFTILALVKWFRELNQHAPTVATATHGTAPETVRSEEK